MLQIQENLFDFIWFSISSFIFFLKKIVEIDYNSEFGEITVSYDSS